MLLRKNERQSGTQAKGENAFGKNLPFYETKKFAFYKIFCRKRLTAILKNVADLRMFARSLKNVRLA